MASETFKEVLNQMWEVHQAKSHDYGAADDPYGNFRPSELFGVPAWIGCLIREGDKTARIQSFLQKGKLENEPVVDALWDKAVYSVIALCLYLEANELPVALPAT